MNCHSASHLLDLYTEGRLSSRRAAVVSAHLADCADCRALSVPPTPRSESARAPAALKARLSAAASSPATATEATAARRWPLWPTEARGIALAAAALIFTAAMIAAFGAPSQSNGQLSAAVEEP